jgi:hypothetical protein
VQTIDFAIMTVARPTVYIHELIASLRPDLPIRLIVGAPVNGYLERYRSNPFIEIIEVGAEEWAHFQNRRVHHRACWNYWRSLTLGPRTPSRKGLVVFEDDVIPARGWENRFHETVNQIEDVHQGPFVLALYPAVNLPPPPHAQLYYMGYPVPVFFSTQAMYYPEEVRAGFADYLKRHGVDSMRLPYDLLLKAYVWKEHIRLFAAIPCLFQHVGEISTGLGNFHKTRQFLSDVTDLQGPMALKAW